MVELPVTLESISVNDEIPFLDRLNNSRTQFGASYLIVEELEDLTTRWGKPDRIIKVSWKRLRDGVEQTKKMWYSDLLVEPLTLTYNLYK